MVFDLPQAWSQGLGYVVKGEEAKSGLRGNYGQVIMGFVCFYKMVQDCYNMLQD